MGVNVTAPDLFGLRRLSALDGLRLSGGAFVVWCENSSRPELLRPHNKSAAAHARDTE